MCLKCIRKSVRIGIPIWKKPVTMVSIKCIKIERILMLSTVISW